MARTMQSVISEQEKSSMASTWTEYLVLERRTKTKDWRLFVGRYEALAEAAAYYDEDTDRYRIPKTIDGKRVVGQDDEWLVGGPLQAWDHPEVSFSKVDNDVITYVKDHCTFPIEALAELDRVINKLGDLTLIKAFDGAEGRFNLWLDTEVQKPALTLRCAFTDPRKQPPVFTASAPNSRKFLNAIRSAWYLTLRRDIGLDEVNGISWSIKGLHPALAKNIVPMFEKMLGERVTEDGEVVNVGSDVSDLPRMLYAIKNVVVAEGPTDDRLNNHALPVFALHNCYGGWPIGYLGWIEDMKFHGTSSYGQNDLPFSAATLQDYAYAAWGMEQYSMSL